uniref:Polygalacturonase QRT2 n=1 Tax=Aegilops tauschii TaxID=37682 RepID=M8CQE0_AEGTA
MENSLLQSLSSAHCNNLRMTNIRLKDSTDKNMILYDCRQVQVHNVSITSPSDSPNTNGINMGSSNHVNISSCSMHTVWEALEVLVTAQRWWKELQYPTVASSIGRPGRSSEREAIKIMCRKSVPCRGIYLENVDLSWANHSAPTQAVVQNAHGSVTGTVKPQTQLAGN